MSRKRKKQIYILDSLLLIVVFTLGAIFYLPYVDDENNMNPHPKIDATQLQKAIDLAAHYITQATLDNGQFVYRINMNPEVRLSKRYNMLRHAGTIYALASYHQHQKHHKKTNDRATTSALVKAMTFLKNETLRPVGPGYGKLAVWSNPIITRTQQPHLAKLGGTGLGLVAGLTLSTEIDAVLTEDDFFKMAAFIEFMQKEDGSFYSKYIPSEGGKNDRFVSLFYPGEAALGMALMYERFKQTQHLTVATNALMYLADLRKDQTQVEADHWALLATSKLLKHLDNSDPKVKRLKHHAKQIVQSMLNQKIKADEHSLYFGAVGPDGRTTPTATRLEGLIAIYDVMSQYEPEIAEPMKEAIYGGIDFLIRAQIKDGEYKGGFPRAIAQDPKQSDSYNRRVTEIRIDYVQHALSAMLQFEERF